MTLFAACLSLLAAYTLLMLRYRRGWSRIRPFDRDSIHSPTTSVSVLIPARNEETQIARCLDGVVDQEYPKHQMDVTVVDDHSDDDTGQIVGAYSDKGVRLIALGDGRSDTGTVSRGKKRALEAGVSKTTGEFIVTTDADCIHPKRWIDTLAGFREETGAVMVAAPVRYTREGNLLDVFQSLDFMTMQGITAVSVTEGLHAMANGANLAFDRTAFEKVHGYAGIDGIASGDDMLLMEKVWNAFPGRVGYCLSREAVVDTEPPHNLKAFLSQRIRWASKAPFYRGWRIRLVLLLVYLFNIAMLAYLLYCFHDHQEWGGWLSLLFAKSTAEMVFLWPVARFFGKQRLLAFFIPMQPLHILYIVVSGFFGQVGPYSWKGRVVK